MLPSGGRVLVLSYLEHLYERVCASQKSTRDKLVRCSAGALLLFGALINHRNIVRFF